MALNNVLKPNNLDLHAKSYSVLGQDPDIEVKVEAGNAVESYNFRLPRASPEKNGQVLAVRNFNFGELEFSNIIGEQVPEIIHHVWNFDGVLNGASSPVDGTLYELFGPASVAPFPNLNEGWYEVEVQLVFQKVGTGANSQTNAFVITPSAVGLGVAIVRGGNYSQATVSNTILDCVFNVSAGTIFTSKTRFQLGIFGGNYNEGNLRWKGDNTVGTTYDDYRVLSAELKISKIKEPVVYQQV